MKEWFKHLLFELKEAVTTYKGWLAWILANLIVSSPWIITGILYVITNEQKFLIYTTAIMAFQWLPLPIESVAVAFITIFIYKLLIKKENPQ
jgi:hypothetical protein